MTKKIWPKIFAVIAITGITASLMPPTAFASPATIIAADSPAAILVVPVLDSINLAAQLAGTAAKVGAQGADTTAKIVRWGIEDLMKVMLAALKKKILDMLVDQIVMWIQGGGKPQFVSDWDGFLKDAFDQATGDFITQAGLTKLCEPLGGKMSTSFKIALQANLIPVKKFSERSKCTLNTIVANVEDFAKDFRSGGWLAFSESMKPNNNFFGLLLSAQYEARVRSENASAVAWSEAQAGAGFLSKKKCAELKSPGELGDNHDLIRRRGEINKLVEEGKTTIDNLSPELCKRYEIITPGKTIGDTLSKAIGSDIDFLVNSEELSEYIAAIADAVINRLIKEGVGILGLSTQNAPRGGVISAGPAGDDCASLSGKARTACQNYNDAKAQRDNQIESYQPATFDPNEEMRFASNPEQFLRNKIEEITAILNGFIQGAQNTYNQLAILTITTCPQRGSLPAAPRKEIMSVIQGSIKFEQNNITTLRQITFSNTDDLRTLTELKTALKTELERSIERTNNNLELFQNRLQQCRS